ncbi:hypothetical protein MtrunA17_Chr3g0092701 [Medicago truncatula]|uniref:Leginsulin related MtN11/16/17 family n=1 Tax=Medicago truncatula TaxID=3880 RepID=A0A072UQE7_MEDTR|nr:leginsulin related MtN11/16/17 family [Medicago truncatula]RHN66581.1 hypothetical protein MtrunA17_Chr3g0092701 [Medicago truncatula]
MTYVKLATLAVFMLTTFLIVQTKNVEAGECPSVGRGCTQLLLNPCGNILECICVSRWIYGGSICQSL